MRDPTRRGYDARDVRNESVCAREIVDSYMAVAFLAQTIASDRNSHNRPSAVREPFVAGQTMTISRADLKLLWGRAGARCSAPGCPADLSRTLAKRGDVALGEMAHVIGRKPGAARSRRGRGADDSYANLILLCPNHHRLVDAAPADFPVELLHEWKASWEEQVRRALSTQASATGGAPVETRVWLYFNFTLILDLYRQWVSTGMLDGTTKALQRERLLDENGFPLSGAEAPGEARTLFETWSQDRAHALKSHYGELLERIVRMQPPLDLNELWGIRKLRGLLYPTALGFVNRRCFFKTVRTSGRGEIRRAYFQARGIQVQFEINTWNIYSNSALESVFQGSNSQIAAILFVRSVESGERPAKLIVKATPVALGTGFWSPTDNTPLIARIREAALQETEDAGDEAPDNPDTCAGGSPPEPLSEEEVVGRRHRLR